MKTLLKIIIAWFLFLPLNAHFSDDYTDIEEMIKTENNHKQKQILTGFRDSFKDSVFIQGQEYKDYYELTVTHPAEEGFTNSAEAYILDKKTGEYKLKWHEQPMKLQMEEDENDQ